MERLTYFDNGRWMLLINGVEYAGLPFVDRLAAYEDTGLTPEEVKALISPNEPLALDELREMDGKPVWVVDVASINKFRGHWDICDWENGEAVSFPYCMESPDIGQYGITWLAYRRRPEEDTNA